VGGSAGSPKSNPFRSSFLADPDEPETFTTRSITATAKAPETSLQEEPAAAAQSEGSYVPSLPLPAPPPAVPATSANPPTMSTDDNKSFVPSPPILAPPHAPIDTPVEAATAPKPASPSGGSFQVPPFATSLDQGSTLAPSGESAGAGKASTDNIERNDSTLVKVFYATDRNQLSAEEEAQAARQTFLFPAACILIGVMILCVVFMVRGPHRVMATAAFGCASVIFLVGYIAHQHLPQAFEMVAANSPTQSIEYGSDRGVLHLGMCEVSIPRSHKPGELESPSIWRLEVRENEERHIVLERVVRQCDSEYYRLIKERVNQSPRKDLFVFVHGYNVTFEDAARRTAQMAFDLKYDGAPIFYSWPSQGELLDYSVDENNVAWTVPHLKKFLLDLSKNSDAKAINLIAHSMGNRALTAALKELAYEVRSEKAAYNEVILAAPDIDADIFKNDIAPAIAKSANRVTLYASSRDRALAASQLVHGYPRAGDSGDGLVIVAGIDTVDVSKIDTTLLGHSYYSGNEPIIDDIFALLSESRAAATRPWLKSAQLGGGSYWVFGEKAATASLIAPRK
jgi:esterase/lipase superfamily enzyme